MGTAYSEFGVKKMEVNTTYLDELADRWREIEKKRNACKRLYKQELYRVQQVKLWKYHEIGRMAHRAFGAGELVVPDDLVEWSKKLQKMLEPSYNMECLTKDELETILATIIKLREKVPRAGIFIRRLLEEK